MLQFKSFDRIMETETIQKNRASSKSQTSRKNFFVMMCFVLLAGVVIFTRCGQSEGDTIMPPGEPTLRYETVPFVPNGTRGSGVLDNLVFYDHCDDYNYYFFVLGHINSVPLAYLPTLRHDGVNELPLSFSIGHVTQEALRRSVTTASNHSITNRSSITLSHQIGVKATARAKWAKFEASYKHTWGSSHGTDITESRSFSNTYETSLTTTRNWTLSTSRVLGNNHAPGFYRWALFSTTDVFFIVVTDRARTHIVDEHTHLVFSARPQHQFWDLDYCPTNSFGKTASGSLLEIPNISVSQLPHIVECTHDWGTEPYWIRVVAPTCTTEGEEIRTCILCHRTETQIVLATGHELIRTITREPTATTDGEETITCARCSYRREPTPFIIRYQDGVTGERDMHGLGGDNLYSWRHTAGLTIESLKYHGYNEVVVTVEFRRRAAGFLGSEYEVSVYSGHPVAPGGSGRWGNAERQGLPATIGTPPWGTHTLTRVVPLNEFNNQFTVFFRGTSTLNWRLSNRTVTVVARRSGGSIAGGN